MPTPSVLAGYGGGKSAMAAEVYGVSPRTATKVLTRAQQATMVAPDVESGPAFGVESPKIHGRLGMASRFFGPLRNWPLLRRMRAGLGMPEAALPGTDSVDGLRKLESSARLRELGESTNAVSAKVADLRLNVLGLDITDWGPSTQYFFCSVMMCAFLLIYGVLQERIVVQVFRRRFGLFVTLLQFGGYAFFALLNRFFMRERGRRVPMKYYIATGAAQALMQGLTNLSMQYLNYPAKVLFKSSRVVCTIVVGVLIWRRRYAATDYVVALLMVLGLGIFVSADWSSSPEFHPLGVGFILCALFVDALMVNFQEIIMRRFGGSHHELILYTYSWGSIFLFFMTSVTGNLGDGLRFLQGGMNNDDVPVGGGNGPRLMGILMQLLLFTACGFFGVSIVAALTKRFGALVSALTTTGRKAMTLMLSFVLFPKPVVANHIVGGLILCFAVVFRIINRAILSQKQERMQMLVRMKAAAASGGISRSNIMKPGREIVLPFPVNGEAHRRRPKMAENEV